MDPILIAAGLAALIGGGAGASTWYKKRQAAAALAQFQAAFAGAGGVPTTTAGLNDPSVLAQLPTVSAKVNQTSVAGPGIVDPNTPGGYGYVFVNGVRVAVKGAQVIGPPAAYNGLEAHS